MADRLRVDLLMLERGLAPSRAKAQELIRRGQVTLNGERVTQAGVRIDRDATLEVTPGARFVSRGGDKLDAALRALGVDVTGAVVVDIGASTGGFTDCVLRRGARRVHAIDVGHGQLDPALGSDPRVVSREGTNARDLRATDFDDPVDVLLIDASFIGLAKLLPAAARILPEGGRLIALVKPQFEVGPEAARRLRGVVRRGGVRDRAIAGVRDAIERAGFRLENECDSELAGPRGNVEHFVQAVRLASAPPD